MSGFIGILVFYRNTLGAMKALNIATNYLFFVAETSHKSFRTFAVLIILMHHFDTLRFGAGRFVNDQSMIFRLASVSATASVMTFEGTLGDGWFKEFTYSSYIPRRTITRIQFVGFLFARSSILTNIVVFGTFNILVNDLDCIFCVN